MNYMSELINLKLSDYSSGGVLAGAVPGRSALGQMIAALASEKTVSVVMVDFSGINVATASFLREAILGFRSHIRTHRPGMSAVLTNLEPVVRDELQEVLATKKEISASCRVDVDGTISDVQMIGCVEGKLADTLNLILKLGKSSAAQLQSYDNGNVTITAWNNRLAALSAMGIFRETKEGRTKYYEPILEGLYNGT